MHEDDDNNRNDGSRLTGHDVLMWIQVSERNTTSEVISQSSALCDNKIILVMLDK
jgi:hypothetical protein